MNPKISDLVSRIRLLEEEIQAELERRRTELHADFADSKIRFERELLEAHRRLRQGLFHYLLSARPLVLLTAPVVYAVFVPLVLLDGFVTLYQWLCFPLYGIPRVRRRDYMAFDRAHLAYLNAVEKLNCAYCSYGNGLLAYVREVVGRTEQYWCPIKHSRRMLDVHPHYQAFMDFGDAEAWRSELQALRQELAELDAPKDSGSR